MSISRWGAPWGRSRVAAVSEVLGGRGGKHEARPCQRVYDRGHDDALGAEAVAREPCHHSRRLDSRRATSRRSRSE